MIRLLHHPFVARHFKKFLRFAVCGGLGACIDFGVLALLTRTLLWAPEMALIVSTGCAFLFVFLSNKYFTFRDAAHGKSSVQALKFLVVYLLSALSNYALSVLLYRSGLMVEVAKALAIGIMMFVNYAFLRSFVFKAKTSRAARGASV